MGPISVLTAFAHSRNIPALKLAARVGIHKVIEVAHRFGVTSNIPAYLPVALGAVEITLQEQVASYSVFPNDGIRVAPRLIRKVSNADGITLWEQPPAVTEVISQQTARTMMTPPPRSHRSRHRRRRLPVQAPPRRQNRHHQDYTDAWFLGFSPVDHLRRLGRLRQPRVARRKRNRRQAALPIWMTFMKAAIHGKDDERFAGDPEPPAVAKVETAPAPASEPGARSSATQPPPAPPSKVGKTSVTPPNPSPGAPVLHAPPRSAPNPPGPRRALHHRQPHRPGWE